MHFYRFYAFLECIRYLKWQFELCESLLSSQQNNIFWKTYRNLSLLTPKPGYYTLRQLSPASFFKTSPACIFHLLSFSFNYFLLNSNEKFIINARAYVMSRILIGLCHSNSEREYS